MAGRSSPGEVLRVWSRGSSIMVIKMRITSHVGYPPIFAAWALKRREPKASDHIPQIILMSEDLDGEVEYWCATK